MWVLGPAPEWLVGTAARKAQVGGWQFVRAVAGEKCYGNADERKGVEQLIAGTVLKVVFDNRRRGMEGAHAGAVRLSRAQPTTRLP